MFAFACARRPPRCALCFKKMDAEPASLVRLECLCEFHAPCLLAHFQKRLDSAGAPLALQCPTCERRVALAPVSALPATATPLQLHACGALESLARHKNLLPLLAAAGAAASSPAAPSAPPAGAAADGGAEDRREKPPAKAEAASLHRRPAAPPAAPVVTAPAPSDAAIQVAAAIAGGGAAAGGARPARPRLFGPQSQRPKCTQRRVIFAVMVLALVGMLTLWLQAFRSSVSLG
jgi:hypothetical protein